MRDFHKLAQRAMAEYRCQHNLIDVEVEGEPATGLRYKFKDEASASRFMFIRGLLRHNSSGSGDLSLEGQDVIELWGC